MIIQVTLNNKKIKNYNLTDASDVTAFKSLVSKAINNDDIERLTSIKNQLRLISNRSAVEQEQFNRILIKIPDAANTQTLTVVNPTGTITLQPTALVASVVAPVAIIAEDGEFSFQALYAHLMQDMMQYTGNIAHLTMYSALVINMFMHAATFTPVSGQGKAQVREYDHKSQLQYYRSQGNHPQATFFKQLTSSPGDISTCRLPFNQGFTKLIGPDNFDSDICSEIKKINPDTGYAKPGVGSVNGYVMTQIAHAGVRKSNFAVLIKGLEQAVTGLNDTAARQRLTDTLQRILKPTQTILKLSQEECTARIYDVLGRFDHLKANFSSDLTVDQQLARNLLSYRIDRVKDVAQKISLTPLHHITINTSHKDLTCLMIRLYPTCHTRDDTYKEGVTNVLLSFFGALLNNHARGFNIHTERRQSFGFYRPTLTDAGCLILRLSLGLEPKTFDDVILNSLRDLDVLLGQFRFDQPTHASVQHVFARTNIKIQEPGKRKPRESDAFIRNIVRKDDRTFTTYRQASIYLAQAAVTSAPASFLQDAMTNFLRDYVCRSIILPAPHTVSPAVSDTVQTIASPIINLLQNTLTYVFDFISDLKPVTVNEPLALFGHAYYHSLLKLFTCCHEAQSLLTQLTTMPVSEFYRIALLLIEDMLEYLISLSGLQQIRCELLGQAFDPVEQLHRTELTYASRALQILPNRVRLFFTDSGQQAITTALLTLSIMLQGPAADGRYYDNDIFLFGSSYFEVAEFVKDCQKDHVSLQILNLQHAKIVFADVSQLDQLDLAQCPAMQALVIDTTHHPLFDQALLTQMITAAHQKGAWVTIVESALKHQQLGLDKYQAGKIITLAPIGKVLSAAATDLFEKVSADAMHPCVATYLQMVNAICREKIAVPQALDTAVATHALVTRGLCLAKNKPVKPAIVPVDVKDEVTASRLAA